LHTHNFSQPGFPNDNINTTKGASGPNLNNTSKRPNRKRTRSPKNNKAPSMAGPGYSILKAKKDMEILRKKCNDELLQILEEEQ
jgi:hypothetical protein